MSDKEFDQTSFTATQPFSEDVSLPPELEKELLPKKSNKKALIILAIGLVVILLLLFTLVAVQPPTQKISKTTQPTPTPTAVPTQYEGIQQRINQLETDVKAADPQQNDLPFPPLNFQLHLQDAQARKE